MKKIPMALIGLLLSASQALAEDGTEVVIRDYMFAPASISIPLGTKVTWINRDDVPHTIAETGKQFRSSALDTDERFSYTFTKPGVYHYFCTLHPQMVATISVTAAR